jgi:F420H(2)-dependent biliverdin reductase
MALDQDKLKKALPRLKKEHNVWFATARPDGRPHLVPIWFVWHEGSIWLCTLSNTQKIRNLSKSQHAVAALEDGDTPVIMEGMAVARSEKTDLERMAPLFKKKFDWDILTDDTGDYVLVEFTPTRMLSW